MMVPLHKAIVAVFVGFLVLHICVIGERVSCQDSRDCRHYENLMEVVYKYRAKVAQMQAELDKRDSLLTDLFGKAPSDSWYSMQVTITWYSLSVDECDDDPDLAAHGKSRPFMMAPSLNIIEALNLQPGDKVAVISDDKKIAGVVVYWDRKNPRYDEGNWVDIVAPSKEVAERWSIREGRIVKI